MTFLAWSREAASSIVYRKADAMAGPISETSSVEVIEPERRVG
jgi:hypothetical protein